MPHPRVEHASIQVFHDMHCETWDTIADALNTSRYDIIFSNTWKIIHATFFPLRVSLGLAKMNPDILDTLQAPKHLLHQHLIMEFVIFLMMLSKLEERRKS